MKPFLGTQDGIGPRNGMQFAQELAPEPLSQGCAEAQARVSALSRAMETPIWQRIVQALCLITAAAVLVMGSFTDGIKPGSMVAGVAVFLAAAAAIEIQARRKITRMFASQDWREAQAELKAANAALVRWINAPKTAQDADVFAVTYRERKGKLILPRDVDNDPRGLNLPAKLWVEGGSMMLATVEAKFALPLANMRGIAPEAHRVALEQWNKPVAHNSAPYHLRRYNGKIFAEYNTLEFVHGGETWGVLFPTYDRAVYESALNGR